MVDQEGMTADSISVDTKNLYREESITDLSAATIRQLVPIKIDGSEDESRPRKFIGDTTLMTQMGPIPVQFPLEADTLEKAFDLFPDGIKSAIERLNERAKELAREEASRIVVPGQGAARGMPGAPGGKLIID
jgi:hypothetical protein